MPIRSIRLALVLAVCLCAAPALAQERAGRPYRGLFGGDGRGPGGHRADVTVSLQQAYDDNLLAGEEGGGLVDARFQARGIYSSANVGLMYSTGGPTVSFETRASADLRYYPEYRDLSSPTYQGGAAIRVERSRFGLRASQGIAILPYYAFLFFPRLAAQGVDAVAAPGIDFALTSQRGSDLRSEVGVQYRIGRRATIAAQYARAALDYNSPTGLQVTETAYAGLSQPLTNNASLRLGYGRQWATYPDAPQVPATRTHNIDAGIDYNRALSISRRTSLSFGSGATGVTDGRGNTSYHALGSAGLSHEMGRTWTARAGFTRGVEFLEGIPEPFLSDAVSVDVGGFLSRRVDVNLGGGHARGTSGVDADGSEYSTVTANARLRVALSRSALVYVQYFAFRYRFDDPAGVIQGLPDSMDRHGVRVGLTWWLPLLR